MTSYEAWKIIKDKVEHNITNTNIDLAIEVIDELLNRESTCICCDYSSDRCEIFYEPLTKEWYLDVEISTWDDYDDGFIHEKVYDIHYCPYCGKKLEK